MRLAKESLEAREERKYRFIVISDRRHGNTWILIFVVAVHDFTRASGVKSKCPSGANDINK